MSFDPRTWSSVDLRYWGSFTLLILLALSTRFWALESPREVVFDEFHFFKYVEDYEEGRYFFDVHPPLGKLMLWAGARMGNLAEVPRASVGAGWSIGTPYEPGLDLFWVRFLPALYGVLLVATVFLLVAAATRSCFAASVGGWIVTFETALVAESQYVLFDSFLFFFFTLTLLLLLLFFQAERRSSQWAYWVAAAISSGLAVSTKWSGLSAIGISMLVLLAESLWFARGRVGGWGIWRSLVRVGLRAAAFFAIVTVIYVSIFAVHFTLLPKSGPGDAFHSPEFQAHLQGSAFAETTEPKGFWGQFAELNGVIYERNFSLVAEHPFASKWYQWPLGEKPIYFWQEGALVDRGAHDRWSSWLGIRELFEEEPYGTPAAMGSSFEGNIFLFGNPATWWGGGLSIVVGTLFVLFGIFITPRDGLIWKLLFVLVAYGANLLPFILVERPAFLYHYLNALICSFIVCALLISTIRPKALRYAVGTTLCGAAIIGFVYLSPLVYGSPTPLGALEQIKYW